MLACLYLVGAGYTREIYKLHRTHTKMHPIAATRRRVIMHTMIEAKPHLTQKK
jgi:hypothetical protein